MVASSVTWVEVDDSPRIAAKREGELTATRVFKVAWSDVNTFAAEMLYGGSNGLPQKFPTFDNLYVDGIDIKPFISSPSGGSFTDTESSNSLHDDAEVTVTYSPIINSAELDPGNNESPGPQPDDIPLPNGTWIDYRMDFSGEFQTIPSRSLIWNSDSELVAPDAHPAIVIPITDHVVTWYMVDWPPWEAISQMRGRVNDSELRMAATHQRAAAESLLFMGASAARQYRQNGSNGWQLTYNFKERSIKGVENISGGGSIRIKPNQAVSVIGWNYAFRDGKTPAWDVPVNANDGAKTYGTGDFKKLFVYEVP